MGMMPNGEIERLRRQYEVQKGLAQRMRAAAPEAREAVAAACYEEYAAQFSPAVVDPQNRMGASGNKEAFLRTALCGRRRVLEVGCGFGVTLASLEEEERVLHGIDVAAKNFAAMALAHPAITFELRSAVRFDLSKTPFDAVYSIDFLEHLHPDDAPAHFDSVFHSLAPGGLYVVMTPHASTGPHDLSGFFDREPLGFHLKEYTHAEVAALGRRAGFLRARTPLLPFGLSVHSSKPPMIPAGFKNLLEPILRLVPRSRFRALLAKALALQTVCIVFEKPR